MPTTTDLILRCWTHGSVNAERLCTAILALDQYENIDPQAPLGGPDGVKDIVCYKNGKKFIVGAYFPIEEKDFSKIQVKFKNDLEGVAINGSRDFIFMTGQRLTLGERDSLISLGKADGISVVIYHNERLRAMLDGVRGYGIRLRWLGVSMDEEEQKSYWAAFSDNYNYKFKEFESYLQLIGEKMERLLFQTSAIMRGIQGGPQEATFSYASSLDSSRVLKLEYILWAHRAAMVDGDLKLSEIGRFRERDVIVGPPRGCQEPI